MTLCDSAPQSPARLSGSQNMKHLVQCRLWVRETERKIYVFLSISGRFCIDFGLITARSPVIFTVLELSPLFSFLLFFFLLISLPVILSSLLQSQVYVPCRQAGRLFSNQVRIAGVDWQAAVSIDSPLHPSISRPAEALTRDGTGGRGERGAHGFKRPLLERFIAPGWVRHQTQKINLLQSIWLISLQRERERLQIITSSD